MSASLHSTASALGAAGAGPLVVLPATETLALLRSALAEQAGSIEQGLRRATAGQLKGFLDGFLENYRAGAMDGLETPRAAAEEAERVVPGAFDASPPLPPVPAVSAAPTTSTSTAAASLPPSPLSPPVLHAIWPSDLSPESNAPVGVWCDGCGSRVGSLRLKSVDRPDYDLCLGCFGAAEAAAAAGKQQVLQGEERFKALWHPDIAGRLLVAADNTAFSAPSPPPTVTPAPVPAPDPVVVHPAACDACREQIVGERFKCLGCPDYDLCRVCLPGATGSDGVHPGHTFVRLSDPAALVVAPTATVGGYGRSSSTAAVAVHRNVICDGCERPIVGPRFKCLDPACGDDYDLCAACEALPEPVAVHPVAHAMIKLRRPMDGEGVERMVGRAREAVAPRRRLSGVANTDADGHTAHPWAGTRSAAVPAWVAHARALAHGPHASAKPTSAASAPAAATTITPAVVVLLKYLFVPAELARDTGLAGFLADDMRAEAAPFGAVNEVVVWEVRRRSWHPLSSLSLRLRP